MGWGGIVRLGLVQAAIGSIVVLATSSMNRVMVVELAMPAVLPGILVALHYAVQIARPRFGHGSDMGGDLTRWIVGGMAVLALGGVAAAASITLMAANRGAGVIAAILAYVVIGLGIGACGTPLLVLLAKRVVPARRAAAVTITWIMMIAGFVVTTAVARALLEPYTHARLLRLTAGVGIIAVVTTVLAIWNVEKMARPGVAPAAARRAPVRGAFLAALREVWREPAARQFSVFVFVSMLAYSGQELIFEPFAGAVFHMTPAQSAGLASMQHGGALLGMVLVALLGTFAARSRLASLRGWTIAGCLGSSVALAGLVLATHSGGAWPLRANAFALGVANGVFTVSAISSMISLAASGGTAREGIRMGLWGAAQAVAFAAGGLLSSAGVDVARHLTHSSLPAYASVFAGQALLFVVAAVLAASVGVVARPSAAGRGGTYAGPRPEVSA